MSITTPLIGAGGRVAATISRKAWEWGLARSAPLLSVKMEESKPTACFELSMSRCATRPEPFAELKQMQPRENQKISQYIRDDVLLVVDGQCGIGRRGIGDIGIKRRSLHGLSRNNDHRSILPNLLGVLMTPTHEVRFCSHGHRSAVRLRGRRQCGRKTSRPA
jgi:hypothetical protein